MPLVFVHGVANRMGADPNAGSVVRDALFRRYLLAKHTAANGGQVAVHNPYWGGLGAQAAWDWKSLPLEDVEALGGVDEPLVEFAAAAPAVPAGDGRPISDGGRVLAAARESLADAVDLLFGASALGVADQDGTEAEALAALAPVAWAYAAANPQPGWLSEVSNDQQFITRLQSEVQGFTTEATAPTAEHPGVPAAGTQEWESLGLDSAWEVLRRGAERLRLAVVGWAGREGSDRIRPAIVPPLTRFLGDVLVYLHQQNESGGLIRGLVASTIRQAAAEATDSDPLVVVGHSMGGIIIYDLLSNELQDVAVPLLVTAGTQVGFFEELKLFRSSQSGVPSPSQPRVPRPQNVKRWVNVFDYADMLGFRIEPVIDGVTDFSYTTGSLLKAHSQYFLQPGFHERLSVRLAEE